LPRNLLLETGFIGLSDDAFGFDLPDFRARFTEAVRQENFDFSGVRCWISQYRIGILVEGLSDSQASIVKEVRGPRVSAAFDYNNQALPAAKGFAAAQGLELKDLVTREVDGEKFLFAVKTLPGQTLESKLEKLKNSLMSAIPFAGNRWRSGSIFPQPPLYFTAILDDQPLKLDIEGLTSSGRTASHAAFSPTFHQIDSISTYQKLMSDINLMSEQTERKKVLEARIRSVLPEGYRLRSESHRLQRLYMFSESLHPILVRFNPEHLEMPEAVISRFLMMNTEYIPCEDAVGKLMPAAVALSPLEKGNQFEITRRAYDLNVKLARLCDIYRRDLTTLPDRIGCIAEKVSASRGMGIELNNPLTRCAVWLAPKLKLNRDSAQISHLLALLNAGESTEIARNLPNTAFAMVMSCLPKFEAFKNLVPVLQEMCSYFARRIPSPQSQLAQLASLSILMCAHARLYGRMMVSPRRLFELLKAGGIRIDIFQAFADIFPDFELDRKIWLEQLADEILRDNQQALMGDSYRNAIEFDPCAFNEAAREWKDPATLEIEAFSALFNRIRSKIDRVENLIIEKPCCDLESEISERLSEIEKLEGVDYLAIFNFFKSEKVNIEACLLNLPAVLDENAPAQMPRIALLQRLNRQLGRLPFIRKDKSTR
jgi:hypothetical protein